MGTLILRICKNYTFPDTPLNSWLGTISMRDTA